MNRYYDRLLPLFRQFLLLPNRSSRFMNLQANCSTPCFNQFCQYFINTWWFVTCHILFQNPKVVLPTQSLPICHFVITDCRKLKFTELEYRPVIWQSCIVLWKPINCSKAAKMAHIHTLNTSLHKHTFIPFQKGTQCTKK